jgi:hypothetical protein
MDANIVGCVATGLAERMGFISSAFASSAGGIRRAVIDEFLPMHVFETVRAKLPDPQQMIRRRDWRERKYVCADLDQFGPALQALVMEFSSDAVAKVLEPLYGTPLWPDENLYNGGVTLMAPGDYMMPHLDNSHDRLRQRRRTLVALFYLSDWTADDGGALVLWDKAVCQPITSIAYRPNRLVIMEETEQSWHSVQRVDGSRPRASLTTYFYSAEEARVRLTRYRAPTGGPLRRALSDIDFGMRTTALRMGFDRLVTNRHARPQNQSKVTGKN